MLGKQIEGGINVDDCFLAKAAYVGADTESGE